MQQAEKSASATTDAANVAPVLTIRGRPINPWLVLLSLVFGFFMSLLDATIVNIAIPTIQTKLNTNLTTVSWVLNSYNLVFAVLLVTAGRFADQFGRKRLFMIGMVIFSLGSLLCALSETVASVVGYPAINWLIGFRALQAIGSAALNPVSLAIITAVFPRERRGAAIGVWGALSGLAAAGGPVLGGYLVQNFDWRWIFFVNLPFCIVGLIMVSLFVPETRDLNVSKKIDFLGLITLTASMFCLVFAIIEGNDWGWTSTPILALFGGSVVAFALFILAELRQKDPIVDFSLFRLLSFSASNIAIFLFSVAIQGAFLILILYFINAQGYDQLGAAYAAIPIPLASFVISAISGRLSGRISPQILGIIGLAFLALGLASLFTLNADSVYLDTAWRGILIGIGMGLTFTSFPNIVLSEVSRSKLGLGSGVFNTFRQIGFTVGVAIMISVFTGQLTANIATARDNSIALVRADTKIPVQLRNGIVTGLQNASGNSSSSSKIDLSTLADKLPPQVPAPVRAQIKTELGNLGNSIAHEFKVGVVDSFRTAWLVAAIVAILGLISAFFARPPRHPRVVVQGESDQPDEEVNVSLAH